MKAAIVLFVLGVYFVIAIAIARFCAVNAGWEKVTKLVPRGSGGGVLEPEDKDYAADSPGTARRTSSV